MYGPFISKKEYYGIQLRESQTLENFKGDVIDFFQFLYNHPRMIITAEILKESDYQKYVITRDMGNSKFKGYVVTKTLPAYDDHKEGVLKEVFLPFRGFCYVGVKRSMKYEAISDADFGDLFDMPPDDNQSYPDYDED